MNDNKSDNNLSFSATFNMTDGWRKFREEQLKEMQDEQKRVEDMLLKKIDEFLQKYTTFNVNQNERNDDKLLDAVAFIARGCVIIGWNECFKYHFEKTNEDEKGH